MADQQSSSDNKDRLLQLPRDVRVHMVEYLNADELRAFSEASHESNTTVGAFLKGQFDRARQQEPKNSHDFRFQGTEFIHRLARLDAEAASRLLSPRKSKERNGLSGNRSASSRRAAFNRARRAARSTAETALRQLSDGLAHMHEQRRKAAEMLWSQRGAGALMVTAMAGRLFWNSVRDRFAEYDELFEWHDLSRLLVGTVFAVTVAVGVSKKQQERRRRAAESTKETGKAAMKRSHSVSGDLALLTLNRSRSSGSLFRATDLPLSVSTPNLHQLLLNLDHHDETNPKRSSSEDERQPKESMWHVRGDDHEASTRRKDPLQRDGGLPLKTLASSSRPNKKQRANSTTKAPAVAKTIRTPPTGCVGAYERAVAEAKVQICSILKEQRKQAFEELPTDEGRNELSTAFIDSCTDDDSIDVARIMAHRLPLDDFYVGSDGTESCGLHTAAFHGACQILDFLCRGIDCGWNSEQEQDGGLCNVNIRDANGWTALHFAAGANSVEAVKILVSHGAVLDVEAVNGYTPLQWALRLQNRQVADELRRLLAADTAHHQRAFWQRVLPSFALRFVRASNRAVAA